jgi:hypothetical protein
VKEFSPELRALLGYTMANYGLGYYSPPTFTPGIPDTLPPELAFVDAPGRCQYDGCTERSGRRPRDQDILINGRVMKNDGARILASSPMDG